MFRFLKGAAVPTAAVALLGLSSLASADTITGTVVASETLPYAATGAGQTDDGFVSEDVVRATSLVAGQVSGDLDFVYQFNLTSSAPTAESIAQLSLTNFAGYVVNISGTVSSTLNGSSTLAVTYALDTLITPTSSDVNGAAVDFHFQPPGGVSVGDASSIVVIYTNATTFGGGNILIQDGAQANVPGFAPAPLPATASTGLALLGGMGVLGGLAVLRRRRHMV